jgi:hypothetical protein
MTRAIALFDLDGQRFLIGGHLKSVFYVSASCSMLSPKAQSSKTYLALHELYALRTKPYALYLLVLC